MKNIQVSRRGAVTVKRGEKSYFVPFQLDLSQVKDCFSPGSKIKEVRRQIKHFNGTKYARLTVKHKGLHYDSWLVPYRKVSQLLSHVRAIYDNSDYSYSIKFVKFNQEKRG